jgi:cytoskeletal protein CcmA (bactofilin family)
VNINGTIRGDVICGAQTINISGTVEGDIRVGAQTVNLTGTIERNATIGAQTVTMDSKSRIGGDATIGATDTTINGAVGRDLAIGGDVVAVNGSVGRDIKAGINKISLGSNAQVGGGIKYYSKEVISRAEGAQVSGQVTQHQPEERERAFPGLLFFAGAAALIFALLLLITALIVTAILPQTVHAVSNQGIKRPWWVLLTGFVASFTVPILIVLLLVTIVGIPLAILVLFAWLLIAFSSGLFTAYWVGRMLWRSQTNALLRVLVGGLILLLLFMIPFIGFLVMLVAFWIGAGMVLLELFDRTPRPKYNLK